MGARMARSTSAFGIAVIAFMAFPAAGLAGGATGDSSAPSQQSPDDAKVFEFATASGALGDYYDAEAGQFVFLYSASNAQPQSSALSQLGVPARIATTNVTADDVATAKAALGRLAQSGRLNGESWSVYFDPLRDLVVVSGSGDRAVIQGVLTTLGTKGVFAAEGKSERLGRLNDTTPFWGGGRIQSVQGGTTYSCTAGFAVKNGSSKYLVTAGHCFNYGWTVTTPQGQFVGTVRSVAPYPQYDIELIGGSTYGGKLWTGLSDGLPALPVGTVTVNATPGLTYCSGGSYGNEQCDKVVIANDVFHCFSDGSGCTDKMTTFTHGSEMLHGDSGGPFYFKSGTTVYARGTIIAKETDGTGYAQEWTQIAASFSVSICTVSPC